MNKLIKSLLFVVLSTTAVFATESAPTNSAAQPVAPTEATTAKSSSKLSDASADFLRFALAKAEKYSGKVEDAIGKGVDLAVQEAPETARQWITWRAWYHALCLIIPLVFLSISGFILKTNWRKALFDDDFNHNAFWSIVGIASSLFSFIAVLANLGHLFSLVQIWVAPRIYMIEELIKLTK